MISVATMIARLEGLTAWEQDFVRRISTLTAVQRRDGRQLGLTPGQVEKVDELHERHFSG